MTNNLKIEVLVSNIPEDGSIASQFPSQEYVNQQLAKKANLSPEGRLDPSHAPDYTEIPGLYEHIEDTKDAIETSIADSLQDAKGYTNQQLSTGLQTKADLVNGKIPFDQIPFSADIEDQIQINVENITAVVDQKVAQVVEQVNGVATAANSYTDTKVAETKTYVDTTVGNVIEDVTTIVDTKAVSKVVTIPTYLTPEAGVAVGTGVAAGAYYNVRSTEDDMVQVEYQNIGGIPTPSGKSYPSAAYVQNIAKFTALPFVVGKAYGLHERVQLENSDIVKSTVDGNANDPSVDMTGWEYENMSFYEGVSDLLTASVGEGKIAYLEGSGFYKFTGGVWKNISIGYGGTVYLDDLVPSRDGSSDCAPAINAAIQKYKGLGVTLIGNPNSTYLIRNTISTIGASNIKIDFNGATVLDDVQGAIPNNGNRAKHTFVAYDCLGVKICNIKYNIASTRSNTYATTSIPAVVFWVGGQYLGGALTKNIEISGFNADGHSIDNAFVMSGCGELDGIRVIDFTVKNGNWRYGCNFEYGLQPVSNADNPTITNGRHPYNIYVERFRGENLLKCKGFLRTASCYNAKFTQCTGFNVPHFIDYYSGDRGITRFNQNVEFELCVSKLDSAVVNFAQYTVTILATSQDGSTGEVLPTWTNRDHLIKFTLCEFKGNTVETSTNIRFVGCDGNVVFDTCSIEGSYWGVWAQYFPEGNPKVDAPYTLAFRNCTFKGNFQDVRQIDTQGVLYDACKFKSHLIGVTSKLPYVILSVQNNPRGCEGTTFRNCHFAKMAESGVEYFRNESNGVKLVDNDFVTNSITDVAITSTKLMTGARNTTNGILIGGLIDQKKIRGELTPPKVIIPANTAIDADCVNTVSCNATATIDKIENGLIGETVEFRGTTSGANITFKHLSTNATTTTRLINKSGADGTIAGIILSRRYMRFGDGWREM